MIGMVFILALGWDLETEYYHRRRDKGFGMV